MKNICALLALSLMCSFAHAQQPECDGEQVVASLICTSVMLPDVRLYISEFQTCENGKITELTRSILGMNVLSQKKLSDIHTIDADNIDITYADQRVLIDPDQRVDFLSFLMPTHAVIHDGKTDIEMTISSETEPDYEGSDTRHFKGEFKMKAVTGKLFCFVYH